MGGEGDAYYVEPASSAFDSQQAFISELETQMQSLGISTLFAQKFGAETAESKRISRSDSDSLLAVVSKDLQASLQNAFNLAAQYAGIEPPSVQVNRDFDLQQLDHQQITQYLSLWQNGAITHATLLEMLAAGETLPHIDVEAEIEAVEQEKLMNLDMAQIAGVPADTEKSEPESLPEEESEMRRELTRRMIAQRDALAKENN